MEVLVLLLLLAANTKTIAFDRTKRMINAERCDIKEHPSIVSLTYRYPSFFNKLHNITKYCFGTGVLITMKWILTSGGAVSQLIKDGDYSKVVAGTNYELPSEAVQVREIERLVENTRVDICLAELKTPFDPNDRIQPAKLPETANFVDGCEKFTVVGWGQNRAMNKSRDDKSDPYHLGFDKGTPDDKLGDLLSCGNAKHNRQKSCSEYFGVGVRDPRWFCFDMEGGAGFCYFDEGFGVFCKDTLVGISNAGYANLNCRASKVIPNAFNISVHMDWLQNHTGITIPTHFYQNITTADSHRRRTTRKGKDKLNTLESESTDGSTEISSNGLHLKAIPSVYPLLICLLLILY